MSFFLRLLVLFLLSLRFHRGGRGLTLSPVRRQRGLVVEYHLALLALLSPRRHTCSLLSSSLLVLSLLDRQIRLNAVMKHIEVAIYLIKEPLESVLEAVVDHDSKSRGLCDTGHETGARELVQLQELA